METEPEAVERLSRQAVRDQARRRAYIHLEAAIEGLIAELGSTRAARAVLLSHARSLRRCEGLIRPKTGPRSRRADPMPPPKP